MVGTPGADGYGDIDALVAQAHERADRAGTWAVEMEQIRGRGTALRGGVTVEVDLGGTVVGLGISDAAAAHGGQSVGHAIREAHAQAQRSVREQALRSTTDAWGSGSATVAAVTAEVDGLNPAGVGGDPDGDRPATTGGAW
jgi:DNA-binding protein YbaB